MAVEIRLASARDRLDVLRVFDAAMLETDTKTVERRIGEGGVLVATDDDRVVGALLTLSRASGVHVDAIAVRRRRRGNGIGTRLVERAAEQYGALTADFDPRVKPFYEALGFSIEKRGERYRGRR